jgi:Cu(I)/Ag(I) efflux system membrane fusion protein
MRRAGIVVLAVVAALIFLALVLHRSSMESGPSTATNRRILYYRDPMHPSYTATRPGKAPDCGMELVPVYADDASGLAGEDLRIDPHQQELLGIKLARVENSPARGSIRTLGRVVAEEDRIFPVTAGAEGWITRLAKGTETGELVKKGQTLAVVYGREYATAERTFLYSLRGLETSQAAPPGDYQDQPATIFREARLVLENMGFGAAQIEQLTRIRQVILDINISSPADGVILSRDAFVQKRFERGTELFRIADLTRVWIAADLFGDDSARVRNGATASVTVVDRPERRFRAVVSDSLSSFDEKSRTLKLRLEAENPGLLLRPDMFVNVEFSIDSPEAVTIPAEGVVPTESRELVFVQRGPGVFEPRTVKTGWSFAGRVQILEGLKAGETIAASGSFFLESERRIRSRAANGND